MLLQADVSVPFKILNIRFMFFCGCQRRKSTQVAPLICFCIFFTGIQPVFAGF